MFICPECNREYEEPVMDEFCYEEEYGVASMFDDMHYGVREVCPHCGANHDWNNEVDDEEDEI